MKQGMTSRADLETLIASIRKSYKVYGPVEQGVGVVVSEIEDGSSLTLEYATLKKPAKALFFPQSESILRFEGDSVEAVPLPEERRVLFGCRPCDARALKHLDNVFAEGEFQDPYYVARRRNTLVVSLACNEPQETCFCTALGGGPFDETGSDVLLFVSGDSLLFHACTDAGEAFLDSLAQDLAKPSKEALDVLRKAREESTATAASKTAAQTGSKLPLDVASQGTSGGLPRLDDGVFSEALGAASDSDFWDSYAMRCLSCSACTFLCPTCHCFAFSDELADGASGKNGGRIRTWDACATPPFSREASGHNPRAAKGARLKQRIMHKFRYAVENFGSPFCVGCGRCVGHCPVNIDVREIIGEIAKGKAS